MAKFLVDGERRGCDRAVAPEAETGYAAKGGDVLVLLADRLLELVDLNGAGLFRELARMDDASRIRVQGPQQRRGNCRTSLAPCRPECRQASLSLFVEDRRETP